MTETSAYCVILTTAGSDEEARRLALGLVQEKLAACVQLVPITSFYTWQGQTEQAAEVLLLLKTRPTLYPAIEEYIKQHHSYEVPELVQLPIEQGLESYLAWIQASTR